MNSHLRLLRPHQWAKQAIVLVPILSLGKAIDVDRVLHGFAAVVAFTCMASLIYIINDLFDLEEDKLDLIRQRRPLAAGSVTKKSAYFLLVSLLAGSFSLNLTLSGDPKASTCILGIYLLLNVIYSIYRLKNRGVLGISFVAVGFPLRFAFGCLFLGIPLSYWALALLMELALFMLSVKRYQQTIRKGTSTKSDLNHEFWLLAAVVFAAFFSASYAGFVATPDTQKIWGADSLLLSAIPMALAIVRFLEIATLSKNWKSSDVTDSVFKDIPLVLLALVYLCIMLFGSVTHG
jgi:decaprenyl-phosphate phosphoribosyltransferase